MDTVDAEGIHTADCKVKAIVEAPPPRDVKQLRSFLGLLNYYGKFLKNLSTVIHPLNQLLGWKMRCKECQESFERAKSLLVESRVLIHYDPTLPIKVAADASNYGIGGVLSLGPKKEVPVLAAARLQRWSLVMTAYNYDIQFRSTDHHAKCRYVIKVATGE